MQLNQPEQAVAHLNPHLAVDVTAGMLQQTLTKDLPLADFLQDFPGGCILLGLDAAICIDLADARS